MDGLGGDTEAEGDVVRTPKIAPRLVGQTKAESADRGPLHLEYRLWLDAFWVEGIVLITLTLASPVSKPLGTWAIAF